MNGLLLNLFLSHTTFRVCSSRRRKNLWHMSNLELATHISNIQRYISLSSSFQITSHCKFQTAWMMWPYMLGGLSCGARVILYEGSPFYPDVKSYLKFIDEQKYGLIPKNASSAYVPLIASTCLVRVPASSPKFRDAAFSLGVSRYTSFSSSGP